MNTITLHSGTITLGSFQADGNDYVFAGTSQNPGSLPVMRFIGGSLNFPDHVSVGTQPPSSPAYGEITQGILSYVQVTHGIQVENGALSIDLNVGAQMVLDGNSQIGDGGTVTVSSASLGSFHLDGTITLSALGSNVLNLDHTTLRGHGTLIQQGENDTTKVGRVSPGTRFEVTGGTLAIDSPMSFGGTIGPLSPSGAALGIFGNVDVFNAIDTAKAVFDTSTGVLSLLNSGGQDLSNIHFAGDVSGLHLTKFSNPAFDFISINDAGNAGIGVGGNIPVTVVS